MAGYAYDAQGRRKSKTVGATTTIFVTDAQDREVLEYDGASGQVGRWFAYGLGVTDLLGQMDVAAGARATPVPDLQGSIIASLDAGSGALTKFGYLPFGESPIPGGTFRYAGLRIDPEARSLYYARARARAYAPALGRFLQPDPIGPAGGVNLYAHADNDPLNQTDPSGLCPFCIGAAIGFAADLGTQLYLTGHYDYRQGIAATVAGGLTGGASAVIGRTLATVGGRAIANAAVGAAVNATQTATGLVPSNSVPSLVPNANGATKPSLK